MMEIVVTRIAQYTETAFPKETITDLFYAVCPNTPYSFFPVSKTGGMMKISHR